MTRNRHHDDSQIRIAGGQVRGPILRSDGRIFANATEAGAVIGVTRSALLKSLRQARTTIHGFTFEWRENETP